MDAALNAELEHIWSRVQAELALAVDEPTYRIWLQPLRARAFAHGRLLVEAPPQASGWIHDRFGRLLQASVVAVLGPDAVVDLVAGPGPRAGPRGELRPRAEAAAGGPRGALARAAGISRISRISPHLEIASSRPTTAAPPAPGTTRS